MTLTSHDAFGRKASPQVLVCAKAPIVCTLENVIVAGPTLVALTICGELIPPIGWLPKLRLTAESASPLASPTIRILVGLAGSLL